MRVMMKIQIPTQKGSAALRDGSLPQLIQSTLERTKAEAAYFTVEGGQRTGFIFFNMEDQAHVPMLGEPIFEGLEAKIDVTPCMTVDDLQRGLSLLRAG